MWSGNGEKHEIARFLAMADEAWAAAQRERAPRKIGGFWLSLAPQDAQAKLSQYVFDYTRVFGEAAGRALAKSVTRSTPDAVREALDNLEAAGCEECFLVPATAELAEVERAAEIVERR